MKIMLIDSDTKYSTALMHKINEKFANVEFDHYLTLKQVEGENSHFPTGHADVVLISSKALDPHPDWSSKEAIQKIFGAVPVVINLEPNDVAVKKNFPHAAGRLEFTYKGDDFESCLATVKRHLN